MPRLTINLPSTVGQMNRTEGQMNRPVNNISWVQIALVYNELRLMSSSNLRRCHVQLLLLPLNWLLARLRAFCCQIFDFVSRYIHSDLWPKLHVINVALLFDKEVTTCCTANCNGTVAKLKPSSSDKLGDIGGDWLRKQAGTESESLGAVPACHFWCFDIKY
jgi:hypothetical protein